MTLDSTDRRIIELLRADGRCSASEVGREVGLSPAAAKRRIDRLETIGVIVGYRAVVDHAMLGWGIEAFAEVSFQGATEVATVDSAFAELPELVEAYTMAGDTDALLHLRVRDLPHLKDVIDKVRRSGQLVGTKTLIVLGRTPGRSL